MNNHLLVPFLMGQRRDGLTRVCTLDQHIWEVVNLAELQETELNDANEKLRRMGLIYARLAERVLALRSNGLVPTIIAGDCMATLGVLGGLQRAGQTPDRILWLDAHGDFHTWKTTQTQYLGGMPLAILAGRGDRRGGQRDAITSLLETIEVQAYPEQHIVLSDARDLDPGEIEALQSSGIVCCEIDQISRHLPPEASLYLHFDTDVMDAEMDLPALKYHVKAGPSYADIATLFRSLRQHNIIAVSVSAWHEEKDGDNKAALACLALLEELQLDQRRAYLG